MAIDIKKFLDFLIEYKGSDLHINAGSPPSIRIQGEIRNISKNNLNGEDTLSLMLSITPERNQKEIDSCGSTDFSYQFEDKAGFRVSAFKQQKLISLVMRIIPKEILPFKKLGLPNMVKEEILRPRGLFLVTGPTGSGKSTTLATMIDYINRKVARHILTIEDPIEFRHQSQNSIITHREVGIDVPSFPEALKRALRQDPDVILIGEMRDLETISIALSAAETGHLVFGTLHTNSVYDTITRIVDAFPVNQQDMVRTQLSGSLNVIICQTLLKTENSRIPAYEIMKLNSGIRHQIRENKIQQIPSSIQISGAEGNILLDHYLFKLVISRKVKMEVALEKCRDPKTFQKNIAEWRKQQEQGAPAQ